LITNVENDYNESAFSYTDGKVHISTGQLTSATVTANQATFSGLAAQDRHGRRVTFTVHVTANRSPASNDTFSINASNGYSASGNLKSGNITIAPNP
jgi:hypothetical protein